MKDRLTLLLVSVLCSGVSYAQAPEQKDSIDVRIYFKQGSSVIDMKFKDNQNRLGTFVDRIAELKRDSLSRILSIYVSGTASPEGNSLGKTSCYPVKELHQPQAMFTNSCQTI